LHDELWQKLVTLDAQETAKRAKCQYLADKNRYTIAFLNEQYAVDIQNKLITASDGRGKHAGYLEQLCLLAYLIRARDVAPTGRLVRPQSLPGGEFFFRGSHDLNMSKMVAIARADPKLLEGAARKLGASKCDYGDAAITLAALPQVPLTFIVWAGDDEFEARASVLFDETAAEHLPLDALLAAVKIAVNRIVEVVSSLN
jgi:hypothetical protein